MSDNCTQCRTFYRKPLMATSLKPCGFTFKWGLHFVMYYEGPTSKKEMFCVAIWKRPKEETKNPLLDCWSENCPQFGGHVFNEGTTLVSLFHHVRNNRMKWCDDVTKVSSQIASGNQKYFHHFLLLQVREQCFCFTLRFHKPLILIFKD